MGVGGDEAQMPPGPVWFGRAVSRTLRTPPGTSGSGIRRRRAGGGEAARNRTGHRPTGHSMHEAARTTEATVRASGLAALDWRRRPPGRRRTLAGLGLGAPTHGMGMGMGMARVRGTYGAEGRKQKRRHGT